jgi:hypothetical protein
MRWSPEEPTQPGVRSHPRVNPLVRHNVLRGSRTRRVPSIRAAHADARFAQ